MQLLLKKIEEHSEYYNLRLNKKKCILMGMREEEDLLFQSGEKMPKKEDTIYLGGNISQNAKRDVEINRRISEQRVSEVAASDLQQKGASENFPFFNS